MKHTFINNLDYKITVTCKSTILTKPLAVFDVVAQGNFEWDQNEGSSFMMIVNETSSNNVIIPSTKVERVEKIAFKLYQGHPAAIW